MTVWARAADIVGRQGRAVIVTLARVRGSAPRDEGTAMVVAPDGSFAGTIGGGTLEWHMLARAQAMLTRDGPAVIEIDQALGPELGQCCGGNVRVRLQRVDEKDESLLAERVRAERLAGPLATIALFGAGHVGRALVLALAPLPFRVVWCDERAGAFPPVIAGDVEIAGAPSLDVLARLPDGAQVYVMTHSHALDLAICARALAAERFATVGVIGSSTKRARFRSRLADLGLPPAEIERLVCPIGIPGLGGKEPAVIAASVAASALMVETARAASMPIAERRHG